jgi:predicted metalloendopeptidase
LSFNAFQRYRKQYEDQKLIGFEKYSAEKLFFLSFAQFYCTVERPTKAKITAETDEHTLGHYRVLASLSNLKEFADAWECPPNSRMNPSKKCSVW